MFVHMRQYWANDKIQHYFQSIAADDVLILDLIAEKGSIAPQSDNFFKHDYIWCFLHNFGGGHGLSGNLKNIFDAISSHQKNSNWKGIGISMEGIHNNPILYDAVLSHSFDMYDDDNGGGPQQQQHDNNKMDALIKKYVSSRYGKQIFDANDNAILSIWMDFVSLFYQSSNGKWSVTRSLITKRPRNGLVPSELAEFEFGNDAFYAIPERQNEPKLVNGFQTSLVEYTLCREYAIWNDFMLFVSALPMEMIVSLHTLANDVAEVTRQFLSDLFQQVYILLMAAEGNDRGYRLKEIMLSLIDDTDAILSDFEYFRLDVWINNARKYGKDEEEMNYFELNARNLVTLWGPNGEINDYSAREWNGLMSNYYKKRWKIYFDGGDVNEYEKQWQYETIDDLIDVNPNNYAIIGDYRHFYEKLLQIHQKYKNLIQC